MTPTRAGSASRKAAVAVLAAIVIVAGIAAPAHAAAAPSAEPVVREFLRAFFAGDVAAARRIIEPNPGVNRLLQPRTRPDDELAAIADEARRARVEQVQEYRFQGKALGEPPANGSWPVGTTARFMAPFRGSLLVVSTVYRDEGWKVDLRWWVAQFELMEREAPPPADSPEYAAKSLVASMLDLRRDLAARYVVPGADVEALFAGAPPYREPSGHLMALVGEMPLVEAGPDEYVRMPSGRIVRGSSSPETRLLVGIYGMFEMAFLLRRVDGAWKVEPEPYFGILNR
jgi:hypothetical protein